MDLNYIVLDLPCTFFMLRSLRWAGDYARTTAIACRCGTSAPIWSCSSWGSGGISHVKMVSSTPETPQTWLRSHFAGGPAGGDGGVPNP